MTESQLLASNIHLIRMALDWALDDCYGRNIDDYTALKELQHELERFNGKT